LGVRNLLFPKTVKSRSLASLVMAIHRKMTVYRASLNKKGVNSGGTCLYENAVVTSNAYNAK